jgi:RNA polymerase sigma-70 factor (ECF subfamily)
MSSTDDEANLIFKAVNGDGVALELLLYPYGRRLLGYVRARFPDELRGVMEPSDVLQDIWLRAVGSISGFHSDASDPVFRWLVGIARHVIADHLRYVRTAKRHDSHAASTGPDESDSVVRLLEELAVYQKTPSKSAANHELMIALDSAIERLPSDQARALRLRHLTGMKSKEIAELMNRTEGSISMLCNRALKNLRLEMRSASFYI